MVTVNCRQQRSPCICSGSIWDFGPLER